MLKNSWFSEKMHFKHTLYHSKFINRYFYAHILKPLFPVQWQRLEILPSSGWLLYFLSQRRTNSARTTKDYLWNPEAKHTTDYEKKEVLKLKIQAFSGLLRILQLHESILVWLPKPFPVKNMYHDFITKLEAAATCIAHTSAIQLFSWWIFCWPGFNWCQLNTTL